LPHEGFQLIIAAALISIALNPILFRALDPFEELIAAHPLGSARGR
jgi:predicted Kef-type K+ transport protein